MLNVVKMDVYLQLLTNKTNIMIGKPEFRICDYFKVKEKEMFNSEKLIKKINRRLYKMCNEKNLFPLLDSLRAGGSKYNFNPFEIVITSGWEGDDFIEEKRTILLRVSVPHETYENFINQQKTRLCL
jgi:hypothetical protein